MIGIFCNANEREVWDPGKEVVLSRPGRRPKTPSRRDVSTTEDIRNQASSAVVDKPTQRR